jgi:hypothetical protein
VTPETPIHNSTHNLQFTVVLIPTPLSRVGPVGSVPTSRTRPFSNKSLRSYYCLVIGGLVAVTWVTTQSAASTWS